MALPLYQKHPPSLAVTYADVENHALHQEEPLLGTPGAISLRSNANGTTFYVRQFYDFDRRKRDQYLCQAGTKDEDATVRAWRRRLEEAKELRTAVRLLSREGYLLMEPKQVRDLVSLGEGAVLAGEHAFKVIVNRLGIRVKAAPSEAKQRGVVLAIGAKDHSLLTELQRGVAMSTHGVAAVRVPLPERFALHQLVAAAASEGGIHRRGRSLKQAAALIAAMGELYPGALSEAYGKTPTSARKHIRKSLEKIRADLEPHPQAWNEIGQAARVA